MLGLAALLLLAGLATPAVPQAINTGNSTSACKLEGQLLQSQAQMAGSTMKARSSQPSLWSLDQRKPSQSLHSSGTPFISQMFPFKF
mmetsp:Transcript_29091/g.78377  ORF Transcript_29091/g.78377 Transcript_29091/m.78377 type:complete len:87 (+) Transcript_29091:1362-1622(+)